ncbi:integrase core domain-containing protein [Streptomyces sp. NPDC006265]|uniref:integrase core domain-containing protein n=1 Tax=Streptomyces sp. NPDC006265 TaxID=3156740 RepID=UPI0033B8EC98
MGRVGSALDNAAAESFHSVLKVEYVHRHTFATRAEARLKRATWIADFYNTKRRHSAAGRKPPVEFEWIIQETRARTDREGRAAKPTSLRKQGIDTTAGDGVPGHRRVVKRPSGRLRSQPRSTSLTIFRAAVPTGPHGDVGPQHLADLADHDRPCDLTHGGEAALVVRRKHGLLHVR